MLYIRQEPIFRTLSHAEEREIVRSYCKMRKDYSATELNDFLNKYVSGVI
jgi:hypothetical protein